MNTISIRGQIRAFFRAKWVELLFAIPAGMAASALYEAIAALCMPSDSHAYRMFEAAVHGSSSDVGLVAFFGVVAFVVLRWRARNAPLNHKLFETKDTKSKI